MPQRMEPPSWRSGVLYAGFLAFFAWSLARSGISPGELVAGLPNMAQIAGEMLPPATDRIAPMADAILTTFQMALVGTVAGIDGDVPLRPGGNHHPDGVSVGVRRGAAVVAGARAAVACGDLSGRSLGHGG